MTGPGRAAGPLGAALATGDTLAKGANALIMLRRVAFITVSGEPADIGKGVVLAWASDRNLGQDKQMIARVGARRTAMVRALTAGEGQSWRRLVVRPQWRLAIGLGNRGNPYEVGISLHGTYGWPVIPGSTLKGMTCAWAVECGHADTRYGLFDEIFGLPRIAKRDHPDDPTSKTPSVKDTARRGTVIFLDAIPYGGPVGIVRDVVTPHVQPYYRTDRKEPPGEHHNPIPSEFLAVDKGSFVVDLIGPPEHLDQVVEWCRAAVDELGVGGKSAAGYGYLTVEEESESS